MPAIEKTSFRATSIFKGFLQLPCPSPSRDRGNKAPAERDRGEEGFGMQGTKVSKFGIDKACRSKKSGV